MIAVTHLTGDVYERGSTALNVLATRPGYVRGTLARSTDDPQAWLLITEWENVGSYRRALGNYQVKLQATPLLAEALGLPSAFESLLDVTPGGRSETHASDRA